jgi:adenosylcobinamide-GDP ribazoletransferase
MKNMLLAIQFLTVLPLKVRGDVSERDMVDATVMFPLAGACQGLMMAIVAAGLARLFDAEVVCGFVLLTHIASNGGFDLDGLADTADAMAVKSSGDREADIERRLSVMKDSTIGASGATAIVMSLLLKFLLLSSLFHLVKLPVFLAALFMMTVFSKWVTVPAMFHGKSARKDGLGRIFVDTVTGRHVIGSTVTMIILFAAAFFAFLQGGSYTGYAVLFALLFVTRSAR